MVHVELIIRQKQEVPLNCKVRLIIFKNPSDFIPI